MVAGLVPELKEKIDTTLKAVVLGVIAAAAAVAAFFFVCVGIFVWTQQAYGTVTACVVLAVLLFLVAAAALTIMVVIRRRMAERLRRRSSEHPPWWLDPVLITTGIEIARVLGTRRVASLAVLGALLAGILLNRPSAKQ